MTSKLYDGFWYMLYALGYTDDEIFDRWMWFWTDLDEYWTDALLNFREVEL